MCHFFLIPHCDTEHLQDIRGQCRKCTWQTPQHVTFWKIQECAKVSLVETKSFLSAALKLGWQRQQQIQQLTPCALCAASGMDSVASWAPFSVPNIPWQSLLTLPGRAWWGTASSWLLLCCLPPTAARGLLVTQIKLQPNLKLQLMKELPSTSKAIQKGSLHFTSHLINCKQTWHEKFLISEACCSVFITVTKWDYSYSGWSCTLHIFLLLFILRNIFTLRHKRLYAITCLTVKYDTGNIHQHFPTIIPKISFLAAIWVSGPIFRNDEHLQFPLATQSICCTSVYF